VDSSDKTFEQLIFENQKLIHKVCHVFCNSSEDQKDLFQEIVVQLWRTYESFKWKSKFQTWLYRVALNTAISQKRKTNRIPQHVPLSKLEMRIPNKVVNADDEDEIRTLYAAIGQLKPIDRAIIFLYLEEKSYNEIASIIGSTPKNIGVKLVRIKAELSTYFKLTHGK